MKLIPMSEVEAQPVRWLWHPYIPFGKLTLIQGDPGEGNYEQPSKMERVLRQSLKYTQQAR